MIHYDVAIAGAGPAGAVAAALLARGGAVVALLDRARPPGDRIGEALPSAAARALEKLKLPGPPTDPRHRAVKGVISAWGGAAVVYDYMNDPDGSGWRLDRTAFDQALLRAGVSAGARLMPSPLHSVTRCGSQWHLQPAESAELRAHYLVDATGRRAAIGRCVGAKRDFQEPIVAVWSVGRRIESRTAITDRTLIQSVREGWWYGAVLPDRRPIAAFHCLRETAKRLRRAPADWLIALADAEVLARRLATGPFIGAKLHFSDASGSVGEPVAGDRWIACGDAAVSFDPISSQGLLNAIRTGAAAASAILAGDTTRAFRDYRAEIRTVWKIYCETRARFYHGLELLA